MDPRYKATGRVRFVYVYIYIIYKVYIYIYIYTGTYMHNIYNIIAIGIYIYN